jgi:6-phosphogluconolactonase
MAEMIYAGVWGESYGATCGGKLLVLSSSADGSLNIVQSIDTGDAVSAIIVSEDKRKVYAIGEVNKGRAANGIGGDIFVFSVLPDGLLKLDKVGTSMGAFPIDMALCNGFAVIVNHGSTAFKVLKTRLRADGSREMYFDYDEASIALFELDSDRCLGTLSDLHIFTGSGTVPFYQDSPSPHSVSLSPDKSFLVVPERGTDHISLFHIDPLTHKLSIVNRVAVKKEAGPRNIAFHPILPVMYLIYELEPLVHIFSYDHKGANIHYLGEIPSTEDKNGHPAVITVHPSGRYVYVLTRGSNTITTYEAEEDGSLCMVDEKLVMGSHPRSIVFSDDAQSVYISNLDSGNIVHFNLDNLTGIPSKGRIALDKIGRVSSIGK